MKLRKIWNNFRDDGIFTYLTEFDVPWKDDVSHETLNILYHGNHNNMDVSPLVQTLADNLDDYVLSEEDRRILALSVFSMFGDKWGKLYESTKLEFNPLNNYDMTESSTRTVGNTTTSNSESSRYVDDNANPLPTDSGNSTGTLSGTETNTLTRSGNIGVTTSAQLLTGYREMLDFNYFEKVFADISHILLLYVNGGECNG